MPLTFFKLLSCYVIMTTRFSKLSSCFPLLCSLYFNVLYVKKKHLDVL